MIITRRSALTAGAAMALAGSRALPARAADAIVVGTWGGDYGALLQQYVDTPLMKPQGIDVSQDIANNDPRRTKLIAERTGRRGSMDVACINDIDSFILGKLDVFQPVSEAEVPRMSAILPVFRKPGTVPHIYSALAIVYNPAKIPTAPKRYADLLDPKYKGRVGFSDILYSYNLAAANLGAGGTMSDFGLGRKALMDLKRNDVKVYPSNETLAVGLKSEEVWISTMWLARGFQWKSAGIPVETVIPAEGAVPVLFEAGVPKNSRQRESGLKYLDAMLHPEAQVGFAAKMGYVPTVKDAKLPPDLARQISLTDSQQEKLHPLDYAYMQDQQAEILNFWNKEFKA